MSNSICPNCNKKLDGFFSTSGMLSEAKVNFINSFHEPKSEGYCEACGGMLIEKYKAELSTRRKDVEKQITSLIHIIPVITLNNPFGWEYEVISIVTAQSVSGTGVLSEISSSFSDLFGSQSGALAGKLENGENICMNNLRLKAAKLGGNAVISSDIDYAEVGGGKGMLMVCMAGTAVRLKNIEAVQPESQTKFKELSRLMDSHRAMSEMNLIR